MSRSFTLVLRIIFWLASIAFILTGAAFIAVDLALPMQGPHLLAWRGWANILWIWGELGVVLVLFGVALCPALFLFARRKGVKAWLYVPATVLVIVGALAGLMQIKSATGYYDFQNAMHAHTNREALALLLQGAAKGRAEAAYDAAQMLYGRGKVIATDPNAPPQDFARAFQLYKQAAGAGMPEAELNLALMYVDGSDVAPGLPDASRRAEFLRLLTLAASAPDAEVRKNVVFSLTNYCTGIRLGTDRDCNQRLASIEQSVAKLDKDEHEFDKDLPAGTGPASAAPAKAAPTAAPQDAAAEPAATAPASPPPVPAAPTPAAASAPPPAEPKLASVPLPAPVKAPVSAAPAANPACASLSGVEEIVCEDSELSALDTRMKSLYRQVRANASDPDTIGSDQEVWIGQRNRCTSNACLRGAYQQRIADLRRWAN